MKAKLIILIDHNILVSGELTNLEAQTIPHYQDRDRKLYKIIASERTSDKLPRIDYNGFEEKYGIVDVRKLETGFQCLPVHDQDTKFSLSDMANAWNVGFDWGWYNGAEDPDDSQKPKFQNLEELVKFLQQSNVFEVEVEGEIIRQNQCVNKCASYPSECLCDMTKQIKITDNKIKIIG